MDTKPISRVIFQAADGSVFYSLAWDATASVRLDAGTGTASVVHNGVTTAFSASSPAATVPPPVVTPPVTVPAQPASPTVFKPVTLTVGPNQQFPSIVDAVRSLQDGPLDVTFNLDPSREYDDLDIGSHYREAQFGYKDGMRFEQQLPWKTTMQPTPGSRKPVVFRVKGPGLYYGKAPICPNPSWDGADVLLRQLHFIGPKGTETWDRLPGVWIEPNDHAATITLEDVEIEGCDHGIVNGGPNMTVIMRRCFLHDCGSGSGLTHNAYIGAVANLVVEDVLSTRCFVGHLFKTRAQKASFTRLRAFDADKAPTQWVTDQAGYPSGASSYCLDMANAGELVIRDCILQHNANPSNTPVLCFGEEPLSEWDDQAKRFHDADPWLGRKRVLDIDGLTLISDQTSRDPEGIWNAASAPLDTVRNVSAYGIAPGKMVRTGTFQQGTVNGPLPGVRLLTTRPVLDMTSPVRV